MIRIFRGLLPQKMSNELRETALIRKAVKCAEVFRCRALAGESDFNICINADMTVSCNCQDFNGLGRIGSLSSQSLEEIFNGPIACGFRSMLANRKFPVPTCINCSELEVIPASESDAALSRYHVPHKGIMVENTALCNLRCRMCNRQKLMELRSGKHSLLLDNVGKIAALLEEYRIETLYYFNLGEPFLPADILEQMKIIRKYNPGIRIITSSNGQLLEAKDKIEAALLMDYVYISLDGIDNEAVGKYQVGGTFETAYRNMAKLVAERNKRNSMSPIIEWKYVVFRWNDHPKMIRKAIDLAKIADVDAIGFYRGDERLTDRSLRWYFHPLFRQLGQRIRDGKILNLNDIPQHLLSP